MKTCLECGTEIPASRQRCYECSRKEAVLRQRRRAALKRVGPERVEGELARINAECQRRLELSEQRQAQYAAYLAKQQCRQSA